MNSNEPTWTQGQVNKEGPKPAKFPCLSRVAFAGALVLAGLLTGLVIR